jgi:hypothetical protein
MKYIIYLVVKKETCELLHFGYSKFDIAKCRQRFFNSINCTSNKAKKQAINNYILSIGGVEMIEVLEYLTIDTEKEYIYDIVTNLKTKYIKSP